MSNLKTSADLRHLTSQEIDILKANRNTAEDWQNILVKDGFNAHLVQNCQFLGTVHIGKLEDTPLQAEGLKVPVGLFNATLDNCQIGDNVAIRNVGFLSHYIVGSFSILFNIGEAFVTEKAKFGHGYLEADEDEDDRLWIELANENGNRAILPFEGILPADAYLWSRNRADKKFQQALIRLTDQLKQQQHTQMGQIGEHAVIKDCRVIKNVKFGSHCLVSGANRLDNLTIQSSAEEPTEIKEGVELINGIVGYGNSVVYGVKAINFITGRNVKLQYGARFIQTFLADNSTVSCCEVLNNLLFPFHEQHHNNSFLIATTVQGQANIAAGATIGSNHNSRAPDGEIFAERGFWPGLCSNFKHNSYFAAFALLAKGNYYSELNIQLPFALVSPGEKNNEIYIYPAYWFKHNMYALARNSWKFKKRDKRVHKEQPIETDYLAPDTVEAMFNGLQILQKAISQAAGKNLSAQQIIDQQKSLDAELKVTLDDFVYHGLAHVLKPAQGFSIYYQMIEYYAGLALYKILTGQEIDSFKALKDYLQTNLTPYFRRWQNLGGQLVPEDSINALKEELASGKIDSWHKVHQRYQQWWQLYPQQKISHAVHSLLNLYQISLNDFSVELLKDVLQKVVVISEELSQNAFKSRQKDYTNPFRKITYENDQELVSVLGRVEDNSFLIELKEETTNMQREINKIIQELQ